MVWDCSELLWVQSGPQVRTDTLVWEKCLSDKPLKSYYMKLLSNTNPLDRLHRGTASLYLLEQSMSCLNLKDLYGIM